MVRLAAGPIAMGSEETELLHVFAECVRQPYGHRCDHAQFGDELPRHVVHVQSFWLDRFEVTVEAYERCVSVGACGPRPTGEGTLRFDRPDFPVTRVDWPDAQAYCAFRGARLPTEAEFERAARGVNGRRYPWGNLFNAHACNHGRFGWDMTEGADGFLELAPVGSFGAGVSAEGVHDLAGNVSEWVADRYAPSYEFAARSSGPGSGSTLRVVRGGSYATAPFSLRGASRSAAEPNERRPSLGFRCARSASGSRGGAGRG